MGALGDPYITVEQLKAYTKWTAGTAQDALFENAVQSASNEIETICGRQFNRDEQVTSRVFTPTTSRWVSVDDFWTADGLVVAYDDSSMSGSYASSTVDYRLTPANGVVGGQPGWPFYGVKLRPTAAGFYVDGDSVRVTAKWGWAAVPDSIKQACYIMALEKYKLKDAPFGVAGANDFGIIRVKQNPMAANLLRKYRRNTLLVG